MRYFLLFLLLVALPMGVQAASKPSAKQAHRDTLFTGDADFLTARDAFHAGNATRLEHYAQRLKNTPMEVYARYYQLRLMIDNVGTRAVPASLEKSIHAFLSQPEDTPVIDRLRGEWLKWLGKNQQWDLFDAEYPRLLNEDTELTCYALQSRLRTQEQTVLREVRKLWLSGKGQPDSCGPLFEAALSAGIIGEQEIKQRLRLVLETGNVTLAKQVAQRLDEIDAVPRQALEKAAADADRYLERAGLDNATDGQRMAALFALQRLAKQAPDLAIARWERISSHFPEADRHYFYGWLAYEAARKQDARALQWFRAAGTTLNEQQSAWRARAALRAQNWHELLATLNAMGEQQQREVVWQYWKARALQAIGKAEEARKLFVPLSSEFHFYGQMAAEELKGVPSLSAAPAHKPEKREIEAVLVQPGIQRTLALYRMDMRAEALREWRWALRNFNDQELLAAAEIARRNEMYDRAIGAAEMTVNMHDFGLRYLAPYRDAVQTHIRENGLEEAWVYGLMRQESRFASKAKSNVGASGLMQVMPATARWIANKLGLRKYKQSLISQVDTNMRLGTYYMKTVLSSFDGSQVLASAAYNAGPSRARNWRGEVPLEGAIYAETIPFDETRDYVKKVMSNTMYYAMQFDAPSQPLKQRMGVIAPKNASNQQALPDER